MANSDAGTSSGNAGGGKYQVFLNFCGQDTRDGFTSFLYQDLRKNGIHAFMDDEELRVGEEIGGELLQAIDDSQIYIPIFSENYASSKWCLRELIRMVDNISKSKEKQIRPIFFYVEPNHLETESYRKAIGDHKEEHEKKQQEKLPHERESWEGESWEEALEGCWNQGLGAAKSQAEFVDKIVEEVLQELKIKYKSVTKDLVGLDHRVAKVLELLDQVRLLGIYGMGGIGKTTLARSVYNELHSRFGKCCAFLADIRETSKKEDFVSLQKKLLTEIGSSSAAESINDVDDGRKKIGEILGGKKVLVVLDDEIDSDRALQIPTYEMKEMESCHAIELFKRHAFHGGSPIEDFDNLSVDIVNTTGGLPLALEVIDDSKVWDSLKMAIKLKSLALVKCHGITRTPDLSKCLALERLTFDDCRSLKEIDNSITMLTCLLDLNITHCGLVDLCLMILEAKEA
ncbi:TMV resistance protein N-like [Eucalyptus grandis]|uniref:TMV resistance protein N-like n=1 Tax=Eucalyptus grandis TaxID=71139 RepID=UPI00192EF7BD|nr:TMV resistance protein N-like [Eucalyptus grandis]